MRKFDYSFLKNDHSNQIYRLAALISEINGKENIRKKQYAEAFDDLTQKAIIDSAVGSNEIEGIGTSDKRLVAIFNGEKALTHDEIEILGYRDALNYIHSRNAEIDIDEKTIKHLHYLIEAGNAEAGQYKKANNYITEYHADGTRSVRFAPVDYKETETAMNQLLLAYYNARQDDEIDRLLLTFCFVLDFTCIHPFMDGNGRVSRLLTLLLLYKAGYDIGRYISIEKQINEYKVQYYQSLEDSSTGWHDNRNDYDPFIVFMMQVIYRCYLKLNDVFGDLSIKKAKKKERIAMVIENSLVPLSKNQIKEILSDISIRTIEVELKKLTDAGKIRKIGTYKDARYIANA